MLRTKVLGSGSYGTVYAATSPKGSEYAVKRNFTNENIKGIGPVRELELMVKLSHHQGMVNVKSIRVNALAKGNLSPSPAKMIDDPLYFVMAKADTDLEAMIRWSKNKSYSFRNIKSLMIQALLTLEFLHGSGVIHRDLKPGNILINYEGPDRENPKPRLCDLGLSTQLTIQNQETCGVYTPTYRAPEVSIGNLIEEHEDMPGYYGYPADIWALGCTFFRMVSGEPLIPEVLEDDRQLLAIVQYGHNEINLEEIKRLLGKTINKLEVQPKEWDQSYNRRSNLKFEERALPFWLSSRFNSESASSPGVSSSYQYLDLIKGMLQWDPRERLTVSQCIDHPWFLEYTPLIKEMREGYKPVRWRNKIEIIPCIERKWMGKVAENLYNRGCINRELCSWYSDRVLFQAMSVFDSWIQKKLAQAPADSIESSERGRVYTKNEAEAVFWAIVYLCVKYFHINVLIAPYEEIIPKPFQENLRLQSLMTQVEQEILEGGDIYRETLYEAYPEHLDCWTLGDLVTMYLHAPYIQSRSLTSQEAVAAYIKVRNSLSSITTELEYHEAIRESLLR